MCGGCDVELESLAVIGFVIVPTVTLAPSLLIAPGLEWARRGVAAVLRDLTLNPRVSLPPQ